jgi:hypothetical protein
VLFVLFVLSSWCFVVLFVALRVLFVVVVLFVDTLEMALSKDCLTLRVCLTNGHGLFGLSNLIYVFI